MNMKDMKPGHMSAELVAALGIVDKAPPPWLINMQRYGPPPSYPSMKIPGLNAPIPPGASFGYHPGGWGKPPVDEYGRPLYGDVFGYSDQLLLEGVDASVEEVVDKTLRWGLPEVHEYEEEDDEEEEDAEGRPGAEGDEDEDQAAEYDPSGAETPSTIDGMGSVSGAGGGGISGLETPDTVDLRKRAGMDTPESTAYSGRELYHVIQERQNVDAAGTGQLFGSDRVYVLPGGGNSSSSSGNAVGGVHAAEEGAASVAGDEAEKSKKRKSELANSAAVKKMKEFKF
jgi:splicing factor 3B subunit 2